MASLLVQPHTVVEETTVPVEKPDPKQTAGETKTTAPVEKPDPKQTAEETKTTAPVEDSKPKQTAGETKTTAPAEKSNSMQQLLYAPQWNLEEMQLILTYKRKDWEEKNCQIEDSDQPTPDRFLKAEKGNPDLARSRWRYTMWFKEKFGLNHLLDLPHPLYEVISKYYPCAFFGLTKDGKHPVSVEKVPSINDVKLAELGIGMNEIFYHYLWITEYGYTRLAGDGTRGELSGYAITDLKGGSLSMAMGGFKRLYGNLVGSYFEMHEPESSFKVDVINAPGFFNWVVYPVVKLMAKKQTLAKIKVFSSSNKKFVAHISKNVNLDELPVEYGGTLKNDDCFKGVHSINQHALATEVLKKHNLQMFTEEMLLERLKNNSKQ